jgi:hypothetical protein
MDSIVGEEEQGTNGRDRFVAESPARVCTAGVVSATKWDPPGAPVLSQNSMP